MNCVIFDVDGTLATFDADRLGHLVQGAEKHWVCNSGWSPATPAQSTAIS